MYGGRDVAGYASHAPDPKWPHKAKVALNFVINYEEGGENCLLHGDTQSEHLLSEIVGASAYSKFRLECCCTSKLKREIFPNLCIYPIFCAGTEDERHGMYSCSQPSHTATRIHSCFGFFGDFIHT